ncbi:HNH endonuclease [Flavobacterium sp. GSP27]|uniref:HNH endonuclease n=1 Tax=Flavobacterium sp. GSP27 TaxID=2497489 RepID=UPI000F832CD9|nr:HNH endonuclease signature motif containing protein [Flavobacterium sp. GSP27]RTZ10952.1 HNH endonuclease [Flavobacterium sp. GSP27]
MKNLNVFNGNTHDFLDDVVNSKKNTIEDPNYKQRLTVLTPNIKVCFNSFDTAQNTNNHISLVPYGYITADKNDLLKLYNPKAKKLVTFKNNATTILDNRASNVCQYCTINSANTLDHIIPKSEFSEFAVNPKNLLPACSECNGYKLDRFKNNNDRLFLNLYTDILPASQYLFVDIQITNGVVVADYRLSNSNNINVQLFSIIESHYGKLHLFRRFKSKTNTIISEMTNSINASIGKVSKQTFLDITLDKINRDKLLHGGNHYKLILEEELLNNNAYLNLYFI